jgi:Ca2+/Na+ antiporter
VLFRSSERRGTLLHALAVVVVASVFMEQGASALGVRYGIAEIVVGGLVLAAVTSLPNAVAAVYLARRGRGAAALSTALNSNAINVTAGLLIPATVVGLSKPSGSGLLIAGWYLGLTVVVLLLAYAFRGLHRNSGWAIIALYALFVGTLLVTA